MKRAEARPMGDAQVHAWFAVLQLLIFLYCFTEKSCHNVMSLQRVADDSEEPEPCSRASSDGFGDETEGWKGMLFFLAAGLD